MARGSRYTGWAFGGLALTVALVAYFGRAIVDVDRAAQLVGHVRIDPAKLVRWADSPPRNNGNCVVETAADACEDVVVHAASGTAFVACGDPAGRAKWYPPAGQRNATGRVQVGGPSAFREKLFKHDIRTGKTVELEVRGLGEEDFVTHGLDVFVSPEDPSKLHIFAVRHARTGDSIAVFSHTLGSDVVELVRDVKHPNIKTANGVAAVGEFEFYITNDHYFYHDPWRTLEERFGPWTWAAHVQYCDASQDEVACRQVTGTSPGANGIAVWEDRLFVGDAKNGTLTVFRLLPNRRAEVESQVDLGAAADNIKVDPSTGDVIISIFPVLEDLSLYLANVDKLGKELRVPVAALRLSKKDAYQTPELLFYDDGGVLSDMTAMAIDPYNKVLVGAAVLQYGGFAVCKMETAE